MPEWVIGDTQSMKRTVSARIPTAEGKFSLFHYRNQRDDKEHLALVMGEVAGRDDVLVRVHSECFTGDVLGSRRCDCGEQLQLAMEQIAKEKGGILLYLRQEGRGIGLEEKLKAYNLQDQGYDTVEANLLLGHQADERQYWAAAGMLSDLKVHSIRLLTNNPDKVEKLASAGIRINGSVRLIPPIHEDNVGYLTTKVEKMRHILALPEVEIQSVSKTKSGINQAGTNPQVVSSNGKNGESYQASVQENTLQENTLTGLEQSTQATSGKVSARTRNAKPEKEWPLEQKLTEVKERLSQHHGDLPFVTLTWAQSLDGSIASKTGEPLRLSSEGSMRMTHCLRAMHDAILVGIGTVLADNPRLTTRLVEGASPRPVIVDSHLRTPLDSALFEHPKRPIFATNHPRQEAIQAIHTAGGEVLQIPENPSRRVDLRSLLSQLAILGIRSVMVEGGAQILSSFIKQQLGNYLVITIAPRLVGGIRVLESGAVPGDLTPIDYTKIEDDTIFWGSFK